MKKVPFLYRAMWTDIICLPSFRGVSSMADHFARFSESVALSNWRNSVSLFLSVSRQLLYAVLREDAKVFNVSDSLNQITNCQKRTESMCFSPIPVTMILIENVVTVTIIHLFRTPRCLISLGPSCLNEFAASFTWVLNIIKSPKQLTRLNMIFYMHFWDCSTHFVQQFSRLGEVFRETLFHIDLVRAPDVVTEHDPS